ncbi:MAG: hypothetical protein KGL04_07705 [Elusimicrobia bacterium]|nr:hypothetical protein [Elusimicrobiota bacterium]MDE2314043.1 hypothetical protein [Elusimicrobiota bacterium]
MKKSLGRILCAAFILGAGGLGMARAQAPADTGSAASADGVGTFGLGLEWMHKELGGDQNVQDPGGVTARYWFNENWGADFGAGFGFPVISHNSIFAMDFSLEGMRAIKRSGASVFYADLLGTAGISQINGGIIQSGGVTTSVDDGQNGKSLVTSISAGLGFETAPADLPQLRWFVQLNPLGYEHTSPAPSKYAHSSSAFDFFGSNTILSLGFHYQL